MVNVDTVYQKVLTIANKEQRGYITPLEYNLLANQAQLEIFENYFVNLAQARMLPGDDVDHSDLVTMLENKLEIFNNVDEAAIVSTYATSSVATNIVLPDYIYRIDCITAQDVEEERLTTTNYKKAFYQPLTMPTTSRPIYYVRNKILRINDGEKVNPTLKDVGIFYFKKPTKVEWGYVVTNEQALYNASAATDFELHASEEINLVNKILGLAGIVIQKQDLMALGQEQQA